MKKPKSVFSAYSPPRVRLLARTISIAQMRSTILRTYCRQGKDGGRIALCTRASIDQDSTQADLSFSVGLFETLWLHRRAIRRAMLTSEFVIGTVRLLHTGGLIPRVMCKSFPLIDNFIVILRELRPLFSCTLRLVHLSHKTAHQGVWIKCILTNKSELFSEVCNGGHSARSFTYLSRF